MEARCKSQAPRRAIERAPAARHTNLVDYPALAVIATGLTLKQSSDKDCERSARRSGPPRRESVSRWPHGRIQPGL